MGTSCSIVPATNFSNESSNDMTNSSISDSANNAAAIANKKPFRPLLSIVHPMTYSNTATTSLNTSTFSQYGRKNTSGIGRNKSRKIDLDIENEARSEAEKIKLLLLGAGESGKSTFVKQMRILHASGYSVQERLEHRSVVYANTLQSLATIIRAMSDLGVRFGDQDNIRLAEDFLNSVEVMFDTHEVISMPEEIYQSMEILWRDDGVQQCFQRSKEYQLNDSAAYFLDALDRIADEHYIPTEDDILRTRVKTTTISQMTFKFNKHWYCIYDVGGQRTERRKWIHCFDNVTSVFFLAAISAYDQTLQEDPETNRLRESIRLFTSICNNRWFETTSMVLFLNKYDLFEVKIRKVSLSHYIPEYVGPEADVEEAAQFVRSLFLATNQRPKSIYSHFTCATDTQNIALVFNTVADIITVQNMKDLNML